MTHYLKFADETEAQTEMAAAGLYHEATADTKAGYWSTDSGLSVDVVGIIYEPGQYEEQDGQIVEVSPAVAHDGYHINMLGALPANLAPYKVTPTTPRRKFFGVD